MELNLGNYVFRQIVTHADQTTGRASLPFSSLILELLKAQHPIHKPDKPVYELKRFQIVQHRFLKGNRVVDIQEESSNQNADAHSSPPNATLAHLVTEIQLLKDSNTVMTGFLERILAQQNDIIQKQTVNSRDLVHFCGF